MIGTPIPWPSEIMPSEIFPNMKNMVFLKHNGAAFDPEIYPLLGKVYPNGIVKDLRGEFIRGWDDGRGIDASRSLGDSQAGAIQSHDHGLQTEGGVGGNGQLVFKDFFTAGNPWIEVPANTANDQASNGFRVATFSNGGAETRPRNIAFNYIVRAA